MNKYILLIFLLGGFTTTTFSQSQFSMEEIIDRAKSQSPAFKQAETRKENRYWQYRYFQTNYNPQLRLSGSIPAFSKSVQATTQPNGTIAYRLVHQTNSSLGLGLEQPIPWTSGTISLNTDLKQFKDYSHADSTGTLWNSYPIYIKLDQPLFSFNKLRWDRKIEPIRYEESRRDYAEQLEAISKESVTFFFSVLEAQINLQIAKYNIANNDTIYKIETGRYNIGTTSQDKLLQVELQLLRSRQDVAQANLSMETSQLQLRSYIGLTKGEKLDLILPEHIPSFEVSIEDALLYAKQNRAAFLAFERRSLEAEREVAQAKGQRFEVKLSAAFGLNNNGQNFNDVYNNLLPQRQGNLTLSMPVIDWGRNRSRMQTAIANKKLNDYIIAQDEVVFEQEIITQVRQFEMLRLKIDIAKKADEVALERYKVAQNRYLIGKMDITNLNIALVEKDNAKRSYVSALKEFWTAYYDLRRLTLYDFVTKTVLYKQEN